jgi:hypothetical protein
MDKINIAMIMKYVAMHHSGGLANDKYAPSQHLKWENINEAHRQRWNFKSSLGFYGGYNFFVEKDGTIKEFRAIGEETAAQLGHNFDTISICVAGNFIVKNGVPVEVPTDEQKASVFQLALTSFAPSGDDAGFVVAPNTTIDFNMSRVHHHSFYSSTECDCLPDTFWPTVYKEQVTKMVQPDKIPVDDPITLVDAIIGLLLRLKAVLLLHFSKKVVGSVDREACGQW